MMAGLGSPPGLRLRYGITALVLLVVAVRAEEEKLIDAEKLGQTVALTLVCTFTFFIALTHLTNADDEDMKEYTYKTISNTVSIFCAVLIFQSINGLVEAIIIEKAEWERQPAEVIVDLIHMLVWYTLLQFVIARLSGAITENGDELDDLIRKDPKAADEKKGRVNIQCKCFGILLAHMTGFASINAWASLQQQAVFRQSWITALLVIPMAVAAQFLFQRVTDTIRWKVSMSDDGTVDWYENKWDSVSEEAENDVMGLTLSFLLSQAIRFGLSGCLPNTEGHEEIPEEKFSWEKHYYDGCEEDMVQKHSGANKLQLVGFAVGFALVLFLLVYLAPKHVCEEEEEEEEEEEAKDWQEREGARQLAEETTNMERQLSEDADLSPTQRATLQKNVDSIREGLENMRSQREEEEINEYWKRFCTSLAASMKMAASWCAFYSCQMILAGATRPPSKVDFLSEGEALAVANAWVLSVFSLILIKALDALADLDCTVDAVDKGIYEVVEALSLLIGFAWEQCFDESVDAIADMFKPEEKEPAFLPSLLPAIVKMILASICAQIVFEAWKWYLLPTVINQGWRFSGINASQDLIQNANQFLADHKAGHHKFRAWEKGMMMELSDKIKLALIDDDNSGGADDDEELEGKEAGGDADQVAMLYEKVRSLEHALETSNVMLNEHMDAMLGSMSNMNESARRIESCRAGY